MSAIHLGTGEANPLSAEVGDAGAAKNGPMRELGRLGGGLIGVLLSVYWSTTSTTFLQAQKPGRVVGESSQVKFKSTVNSQDSQQAVQVQALDLS
jgi:hypothetical protein